MDGLLRTCIYRLGLAVATLFVVSVVIFSAVETLPGDFARFVLGQSATPETLAAFRAELGLDRPPVQRYFTWIGNILRGDLGDSYSGIGSTTAAARRSVASLVLPRLANTFFLAGLAALIAVPLALAIGFYVALKPGGFVDRAVNVVTLSVISVPEFFVAYVLIFFFAIRIQLFDPISDVSAEMDLWARLARTILPALALVFATLGHMVRMTRATLISVLSSTFIETARLKGLKAARILLYHAAPNAWAPVVAVVVANLAYLVAGVVVVEAVFAYPGAGSLMVDSVVSRNIPVVQACGLIFAAVYVLLNMLADIVTVFSDPRLRYPR
ncbi:MAG: ABC transporter permease [Pseudorhodoplanes sp.]